MLELFAEQAAHLDGIAAGLLGRTGREGRITGDEAEGEGLAGANLRQVVGGVSRQ